MTYQDLKGPIQATSSERVQTLVHQGTIFFNLTVPDPEENLHNTYVMNWICVYVAKSVNVGKRQIIKDVVETNWCFGSM